MKHNRTEKPKQDMGTGSIGKLLAQLAIPAVVAQVQVSFTNLKFNLNELLESRCYQVLCKIKNVIEDDELDDEACFMKIEEIICAFEEVGSSGGFRHDFG